MTVKDILAGSGLERLDAELLLTHALGTTRAGLMTKAGVDVPAGTEKIFASYVRRRKNHEPVALILGEKEFYGRTFFVTKDTLVPRPSTEGLIDLTRSFLKKAEPLAVELDSGISGVVLPLTSKKPSIILDVGTGSGCIALTLRSEGVKEKIVGLDISRAALDVAKKNAANLGVTDIEWKEGDGPEIIKDIREPFLVVSNPPYIPEGTTLEKDVSDFEPHSALFSGKDGLSLIRTMMASIKGNSHCTGVILECRADQVEQIRNML